MKRIVDHELAKMFSAAAKESGVPGAALALVDDGVIHTAAWGVLNTDSAIAVGNDSPFLIGSITKAFTATLVMQLVDRGALSLDSTLADELPELSLPNGRSKDINIRHLLSHCSGIDGDFFPDLEQKSATPQEFATEDKTKLSEVIRQCASINLIYPPGRMFSYCNLGYVFLGRILEKHYNDNWSAILQRQLLDPLQLTSANLDFDPNVIASGHVLGSEGMQAQAPGPWSNAPAGTRLSMSVPDLAKFALLHLQLSKGQKGSIISTAAVLEMQKPVVDTPFSNRYSAWGLGWTFIGAAGKTAFGHDGGVSGSTAFLRILPDSDQIVVLVANGPGYRQLYCDVMEKILGRFNISMPLLPAVDITPGPVNHYPALSAYGGSYQRNGLSVNIGTDNNQLSVMLGGEYGYPVSEPSTLCQKSASSFSGYVPVVGDQIKLDFFDFDDNGCPQFLHFQDRIYCRENSCAEQGVLQAND